MAPRKNRGYFEWKASTLIPGRDWDARFGLSIVVRRAGGSSSAGVPEWNGGSIMWTAQVPADRDACLQRRKDGGSVIWKALTPLPGLDRATRFALTADMRREGGMLQR